MASLQAWYEEEGSDNEEAQPSSRTAEETMKIILCLIVELATIVTIFTIVSTFIWAMTL